ncbi:hypothetical protein [Parvibaculum sp.]|uniref:hypothetical protein n=1 Tax=Parvibaculum sp. TaxID=2024848 RepID=UPI00273068DF|nr:hypothetical protein [Parvibaculum sp.]MDP1626567.1 hypothetical protein [Parvibaculum sp.]MDP2150489.1 hypothetical protein [Parvibaculum sp.]MDP3327025.1 hypothetical protein [Parvibaculum sp.]
MSMDRALIQLPEMRPAHLLLRSRWRSVETCGGQISYESKQLSGVWSVPSILIRNEREENILVYVDCSEYNGQEQFRLRFVDASDEWATRHISTARPPFAPVSAWPPRLRFPVEFMEVGPSSGEFGLGPWIAQADEEENGKMVSVCWCLFRSEADALFIFPDDEVPMNVGLAGVGTYKTIQESLQATSIIKV